MQTLHHFIEYIAGACITLALVVTFTFFDNISLPFNVPLFLLIILPLIPFAVAFVLFACGNRRMAYGALATVVLGIVLPWWMILPQ